MRLPWVISSRPPSWRPTWQRRSSISGWLMLGVHVDPKDFSQQGSGILSVPLRAVAKACVIARAAVSRSDIEVPVRTKLQARVGKYQRRQVIGVVAGSIHLHHAL